VRKLQNFLCKLAKHLYGAELFLLTKMSSQKEKSIPQLRRFQEMDSKKNFYGPSTD
jgi:hypothetical protein